MMTTNKMSNVELLRQKLNDIGVTRLHVFKGELWNDSTLEQRAEELLKSIEAIERGDFTRVDLGDKDDLPRSESDQSNTH